MISIITIVMIDVRSIVMIDTSRIHCGEGPRVMTTQLAVP